MWLLSKYNNHKNIQNFRPLVRPVFPAFLRPKVGAMSLMVWIRDFISPRLVALPLVVAALSSCGDASSIIDPVIESAEKPRKATVATVAVTPTTASVQVGATVSLQATALDAGGSAIAGKYVSWSSAN